jgi:hypothetical protein
VDSSVTARRGNGWLVAVAVLHGVAPLVLIGLHWWFGVDETVYLSQINAHVPAGFFSAPRARGTTLVAAPVTLLTSSVAAVRVWLAALSAAALYVAWRPWSALRPGGVVALAALLFSTIWSVIYYSFEAMPNEWVAFGAVAATGFLLRHLATGARRDLVATGLAVAVVALFRPSDALYSGAALLLGCLLLRGRAPGRRRLAGAAAVAAGAAAGAAEWIVEAHTSYGGVRARIAAAQAENGGGGLHFAGAAQLRALTGPLLCRNGCRAHAPTGYELWWLVAAVLVGAALVLDRRRRSPAPEWMPALVGAALAGEYVFTVTYAAPRFLIPAYALLALPCASALAALVGRARARPVRVALAVGCAGVVLVQAVAQALVIRDRIAPAVRRADRRVLAEAADLRRLGLRPPCLVLGEPAWSENLAYADRCSDVPSDPAGVAARMEADAAVVDLGSGRAVHDQGRRVSLPGARPLIAYLVRPEPDRDADDTRAGGRVKRSG